MTNLPNTIKQNLLSLKSSLFPSADDLVKYFINYLDTNHLSPQTISSYKSDVSRYLDWASTHIASTELAEVLTKESIEKYLNHLAQSSSLPSTVERKKKSLTRFSAWSSNPSSLVLPGAVNPLPSADNLVKYFTNDLNANHLSPQTISSYKSDITRYLRWAEEELPHTKIAELLTKESIEKYLNHLAQSSSLPSTVERKKKSLTRFSAWSSKTYSLPTTADNLRPNDYNLLPTQTFNFRSLLTLGILLLFISTLAIFGYRQFSRDASLTSAYPSTAVTPNRQLSFQGRLENAGGTPITAATDMVFKLFTASSGGTELYSTGTCAITPDSDGVFNTQIGSTCGAAIAATVFTENAGVWLEVTIVAETLAPRQQIATVAYALNSETLQGFPLSSTISAIRNTIVPMNQFGEIIIGEQSPRLTGVSGTFTISAPALSLTSTSGQINLTGNLSFAGIGDDITFTNLGKIDNDTDGIILLTATTTKSSGNLYVGTSGTGTITSGLINSQTISSAANFTGTMAIAGNVGIGTTGPAATSLLDLTSTTKGFLAPRMTTTQRDAISTPATGLMIYNTTDNQYNVFNGTTWGAVGGGGGGAWSDITLPTDNLAFSMGSYTTAFTWTGGGAFGFDSNGNVGVGNTVPVGKLDVSGAVTGKSLVILNETGDQNILTASASGVTRMNLTTEGYVEAQRFADLANTTYYLDPAAAGVSLAMASGSLTSGVVDGATAVAFTLNSTNTLSTQGSKLLSLQNNGTEKMYLDKDGNLYVSGTVVSGNGTSMLLTNKSGGIVASKAIVVLDTSNNTSFTTTTTPYNKAGFGVVVGVGLGVANDVDGDGVCDANDICMVAYGGSVNVTVKNATTAVKGDYLFTSDTAGSAVASAKQYDGLVGIVDDTTNAASGYLKMIFKVQPQVTAAAAIDKTTKHNEYWLYADQYQAVGEGANTDTNLLQRGLAFDTFTDSTKTDSANTTASLDTNTQKTGLIGGQTLATSTTDNDGQTYLGSNTVNDTYYYDRVKLDSAAQVQVELGIDPNWYNGVTLSVATTSATFSQNSVITQPNPNLSTSYNGSLVKVTGTDSTPRTIYITIKSPTTFDWTNYQGDAATGVTITPGTAQALGTTGVSATFTNARYNTGDVFKIASWFIEAESATRGAKQQFPEKSTIIATASSVDIIDADTQKLWMRFSQGTSYAIGVDANNDPSSANMLNGELYVSQNGSAATGLYRLDFTHDAAFKQNATDWRLSDTALSGRNGANTYNVINTSNILVNITANDVSAAVIPNQPTQEVTVSGWGYLPISTPTETVNLPYKFNNIPNVVITAAGRSATAPVNFASCTVSDATVTITVNAVTTSTFLARSWYSDPGQYECYSWTATGQVSPRQYVGAATDAGVSVINETDQSAASINSTGDGSFTGMRGVSLLSNGNMYLLYGRSPSTANEGVASIYKAPALSGAVSATLFNAYDAAYTVGIPAITNSAADPSDLYSLSVTQGTSTIDGKSNTIYVGTSTGLSVIQEKQSGANSKYNGDNQREGSDEVNGSVKYYTKDYISEEMVGDIRGMWPLYEGTGTSADDISVKNHNSSSFSGSPTWVSGVRGKALDFNRATPDSVIITDHADFTLSGDYSVGAWINPDDVADNWKGIMGDYAAGPGGFIFALQNNSTNDLAFEIGASTWVYSGYGIKEDGNWKHVVYTRSGTTGKFYVNGQLVATVAGAAGADGTNLYIGTGGPSWANGFDGKIDEPFVTATELSSGQIKNMYQVGYRALQSHATTLGGGAADTNQQLGGTTNTIGAAQPDYNNQFMYVGTNSTTLGAVSKIDLNSDTNIKTYNSSANVPAGGALLIDEDTKSLAVGYNLEAVGSATTGVKTMGVDNNATATSGNFIGKTITTAESFNQAYLWAQYTLDASDASNTIEVWASNDGGSNYSQCNLTNTDTSRSPSEYEYFCQFNTAGSSLKTKFVMARGSTKTNTYVSKYGISWIDSNAIAGSALGSGLYTGTNASVANGSYIDVAHNQNSNDVVTNGWIYDGAKWVEIDDQAKTDHNTQDPKLLSWYKMEETSGDLDNAQGTAARDLIDLNSPTYQATGKVNKAITLDGTNDYFCTGSGTTCADENTLDFAAADSFTLGGWFKHDTITTNPDYMVTKQDPLAGTTKVLLHMDGADGSTTFTDESGKTWTTVANAQIDTAQSKFGGASGLFDGTGDWITTPDHDDFNFGTGDFTIDMWVRPQSDTYVNNFQQFISQWTDSNNTMRFGRHITGNQIYFQVTSGGSAIVEIATGSSLNINTWYHLAVVRSGNVFTVYKDGVSVGTQTAAVTYPNYTGVLYVGTDAGATNRSTNGHIDELRISKGIARWTAGFTPPALAYGMDPGYKLLMESDGDLTFGIDDDSTSFPEDSATSTVATYDDNAWHHVVAVKNGTSNIKLYVDGEEVASDTSISATGTLANDGPFYLGVDSDATSNPWAGQLDETFTYSRALTPGEIQELYRSNRRFAIEQTDANTVRLYNYSGSTQNLRLDVITGGLGRNAGTVSLAPAAADVDSQASTNSLWINKTGSGGNLLKLQTSGADMTLINNLGDITGGITTLDGSTTANGAGTASTTLILTSATNFNVGNYVKVSSTDCVTGVNVCYAKITNIATNTLTISPALTWANASAVVEVHVPELGGIDTSQALANRYGRGYFVDGIVAGNGSSYFTDNLISFGGGSKIQDASGKLQLQAGGTGTGSTGTGSIYFLDSSGTARGRFDTSDVFSGATGGTIATASGYTTHTFTATETVNFTPNGSVNVEYLVVGGGGGGGADNYGGGGGAGGVRTGTGFAVTAQAYSVTVGSGGPSKTNGEDSIFSTITSIGGGRGGSSGTAPSIGGSGGGGGGAANITGAAGTSGQGHAGGNGYVASNYSGGGGGGAGAVGSTGLTANYGGRGGDGISNSISGSVVYYGGGGGGSVRYGGISAGVGGSGGGGAGGAAAAGQNGTPNTGGGGGGGSYDGATHRPGGVGGSGIVIVRYLTAASDNNYGTLYLGSTNTSSADLAEYYVAGDKTISAGDVVSISNTKVLDDGGEEVTNQGVMRKANKPYDSKLIGIISTNPGVLMGSIDGDTGKEDKRMLALSGRVPVKIDPDSEPIEAGDFLTSSDKPGLAKKATQAGYTIGKALESWSSGGASTIEVFVNLGYHDPDLALTDSGDILLASNSSDIYNVSTTNGITTRIGAFAQASIAKLKAGVIETNLISPLSPDQPIAINGPVVIKSSSEAQTPPLGSSGAALIVEGEIEATTISARLAKLDEIQADTITARNIVADTISANHIEGLDAKIASLSAGMSDTELESITDRIKARLALLTGNEPTAADIPTPPVPSTIYDLQSTISTSSASLASADIDFATINNYLAVIGQAVMTDLDVTGHLYAANINSKTGTLALGDNTLIINSMGEVAINGDLTVSGSILAEAAYFNSLSLGAPSSATNSALGQLLQIYDESGKSVATIDKLGNLAVSGDLTASGSANLAQLSTNLITIASSSEAQTPLLASSGATSSAIAQVLGTSSSQKAATAGVASITSPGTQLTIGSPYITPNSLVYLTPTDNTEGRVLYVKSKNTCEPNLTPNDYSLQPTCIPSFTVALDAPARSDISFNWWVIQLAL